MNDEERTAAANRIVYRIIDDLADRRGLRQEWDNIDEEIQAEIRETWMTIVMKEFAT